MPQLFSLKIIKNEPVQPGYSRITCAGNIGAKPGQFVQVQTSDTHDPLLRRPLSVHDSSPATLTLLFRHAGRGTELLARKKPGESLNLIGPLGSGFSIGQQQEAVVVAGGIGAAPLYFLLRQLQESGKKVSFFYGARSKHELLLRQEYSCLATEYAEATDDGSAGLHGFVTELAKKAIAELDADIYACGPAAMLRQVARLAQEFHRECYVSLEAHMACGVGACLGCVVPVGTEGQYKRVCVDGPVFNAQEVFI
jgi:dihydroorotate dehydrogenase electron transfer subunit